MKPEKPHFILTAAIASVLALAHAAFAASGTWNNPAGGSWNSSGNWSGGTIADGSGFTADFSTLDITAGAKTVTLDAGRVIGNLTFGDTNTGTNGTWLLATGSGGALTLAGTTPTITANVNTTISAAMLGTSGFTKSGGGTLTLSGSLANTIAGAINVNGGTLLFQGGSAMSGPITVASGAVFSFNQNFVAANTLPNALNLSGPGIGSNGALNLFANATASGPITLGADTTISHSYNNATISGSITGTNRNLTLKTTVGGTQGPLVISAPITLGTGGITVQSAGGTNIVTLSGSNSYSGGTILSTGTLKFSHAGALGSGTVTFEGNTTLQAGVAATLNHAVSLASGATGTLDTNGYDVVLGGAITGSGNLVKSGNARLTLTGTATYTGSTTVSAGTLALVGGSQASPITVAGGASLEFTLGAPCTSTSSVNLSSGTVKITNTPSLASYTLMTASGGFIGTPVLDAPIPGYSLVLANGGTQLQLVAGTLASVPKVTGMSQTAATSNLLSAGLVVGAVTNVPSVELPAGQVISQTPAGGVAVVPGTSVALVVSVPPFEKYTYQFPDGTKFVASDTVNNTPRDLILQAISSGATEVTIPPGIYRMTAINKIHISIQNVNNLTIHANKVIILCDSLTRAVSITNCQNLVINGLTIDYAPTTKAFPFTQGEIIAKGTEGDLYTADVKIHEGYPLDIGYPTNTWSRMQVFDPVLRRQRDNVGFTWDLTSELVDVNQRIVRLKAPALDYVKVGELAVLTSGYTRFGYSGVPHAVGISSSPNTSFYDVTLHTSISFGILHLGGAGGGTFRNVRIVRGPILPGATEPRLKTTMHDGWKIGLMAQGVTVENCEIEHTGDDGWSIAPGSDHLVAGISGNRAIVLTPSATASQDIVPGSHLRIGANDPEVEVSQVLQFALAPDWATLRAIADPAIIDQVSNANGAGDYNYSMRYYELQLASAPTFEAGDKISIRELHCDGYIFRNNRMTSTGRLLFGAGSNGLIENNDLIAIASVSFCPEKDGSAAFGMKDIIFRNNRLVHLAHKIDFDASRVATGAFSIVESLNGSLITAPQFFNFQIVDNEFIDCKIANFNIAGVKNLTIARNIFSESGTTPPIVGGENYPFKQSYMINVINSSDVEVAENSVQSPGIYIEGFLNMQNSTNVTAPSGGFTLINAGNDAPVFFADPISKPQGTVGSAYSDTLADDAGDLDRLAGDTLTYSKVNGPAWLTVASNGTLSGTPGAGNGGLNTFTVRVQDTAGASDTATLNIPVNTSLTWDGGGPADTWSDPVNWNATGNNDIPNSNLDTAFFNSSGSINITVDGNFTIKNFLDGFPGAGSTVTLSGPGVLTFDGNSASVVTGINNATGNPGSILAFDCGVIINNSLGGETQFGIGNSAANVIRFGPNSTLSLQSPFNTTDRDGSYEFNGTIGSGTSDLVLTGKVTFGTGHNSSAFNKDMHLASTSTLTINAGTVLSEGRKFQILGSGSKLELNGTNVVNGPDISVEGDYDFLIDVNASQDDFGWLKTGTGTVTIELTAGVSLLAFDDSSAQNWTGGSVVITNFSPGVIRFGTNAGGITANQLASITAYHSGGAPVSGLRINNSGFLTNLNDPPAAPAFTTNPLNTANATEDIAYTATIAGSATDANGDTLRYAKVSGPAWLSVAANGALSGTPTNSHVGVNSFIVSVTDDIVAPVQATLNITVINTNDAPVASNGSATTSEDTAVAVALAATDADVNDVLSYTVIYPPTNGTLSGTAPNLTYTPNANTNGADSFTFKANDGTVDSNIATVNLTVNAVNDPPVTSNGSATTNEDTAVAVTLVATDIESTVTYSVVSGPGKGTLSGTAPNLTYTPNANTNGADSFTFSANDGTADSNITTVNLTVNAVNDAPVFSPASFTTADASEGLAYTGQTLSGRATDADAGAAITYSRVSGPAWLVIASDGALSGTPPSGSAGMNSFVVRATDNNSATADATLQINVTGLPLPWLTTDIGMGMLAGSASFNAGTFTQSGSGVIGSTSDQLHFAYQTLTGDGEIIARISNLQNTGNSSRVGVMIRDTLASNSKQILMGLTGSGSYRWARRTTTGGSTSSNNSSTGTVPNTWVRLVRSGTTITAYKSSNGTSWTTVGSTTNTSFASTCYIGLAVGSGSNTTLNTSQFSNVSVTP